MTAHIIGPRTLAQFESALGAVQRPVEPELLSSLEELFPGPGGAAPEAYAW